MTPQTSRIVLLGPQRRPALDKVVAGLELSGPFATITAGWQEREVAYDELHEHLGGRAVNLKLWSRRQDVLDRDPAFAAAHRRREAVHADMQRLYLIGVAHTSRAITELREDAETSDRARELALRDALEVLRSLDRRHLERVRDLNGDFYSITKPHEHELIAAHRAEVAGLLAEVEAVVIAGGHVGELLDTLHLFNLAPAGLATLPLIAWSAGAMVLTERVILFNDNASRGPRTPELYDDGLGRLREMVALPSAHKRLQMNNLERMSLLAKRFAPASCVPLDPGARIYIDDSGELPGDTPVIGAQGEAQTVDTARESGESDHV